MFCFYLPRQTCCYMKSRWEAGFKEDERETGAHVMSSHISYFFYDVIADFVEFTTVNMNDAIINYMDRWECVCWTSLLKGLKYLLYVSFPSAYVASEAADEEVMFHSCVLNYAPILSNENMDNFDQSYCACFPIWSHCFCFLCVCVRYSFRWRSFPFVANSVFLYTYIVSSVFPFYVTLDISLSVIPCPPPWSPPNSHQATPLCKGALPPANGKLLHRRALLSRYCDKCNTNRSFIV